MKSVTYHLFIDSANEVEPFNDYKCLHCETNRSPALVEDCLHNNHAIVETYVHPNNRDEQP